MSHIRECLPEIKSKINKLLADVQMNIDALGEPGILLVNCLFPAMNISFLSC